jgi:hypothetical protein
MESCITFAVEKGLWIFRVKGSPDYTVCGNTAQEHIDQGSH